MVLISVSSSLTTAGLHYELTMESDYDVNPKRPNLSDIKQWQPTAFPITGSGASVCAFSFVKDEDVSLISC